MAISRVEKFKEYRKSIISDGEEPKKKETIDTTLVNQVNEVPDENLTNERVFAGKLARKKKIILITISVFMAAIVVVLIVLGCKYF